MHVVFTGTAVVAGCFFVQAHLLEDHGITDRRAVAAGGVGFNVRRAARDGSGLHSSGGPVAEANTPVGRYSW